LQRTRTLVALTRASGVLTAEDWEAVRSAVPPGRDPLFGGVNPEPIEPHVEALRRAVLSGGYDAGLCADGDGDRIGAMDRDGTFITPHQIFSILLWHLAGTRNIPGIKNPAIDALIDRIIYAKDRVELVAAVVLVLIIELLNTAIEKLADRLTTDHDPQIGRVKDMGSAAVGVTLVMAALFWLFAIAERMGAL